jgi:hypothetical protein
MSGASARTSRRRGHGLEQKMAEIWRQQIRARIK